MLKNESKVTERGKSKKVKNNKQIGIRLEKKMRQSTLNNKGAKINIGVLGIKKKNEERKKA